MRITNSMLTDMVIYNTQKSLARYLETSNQIASGRRINKPSDDPLGIVKDLDLKASLSKNAQYQKNINEAQNWTTTYDSTIGELSNLITSIKETAISMANGTYDEIAREAAANEVESLYEQILQLSVTDLQGKYLFSGYRTDGEPLQTTSNGVRYDGDDGQIQFQIGSSSNINVNLLGSDIFMAQLSVLGEDADLELGLSGSTLLADLNAGEGIDQTTGLITITDENLGVAVDVDLSGATTIDDVINEITNALSANVPPITNLTVEIGPSGNSLSFVPTDDGQISNSTQLSVLNGGGGIDFSDGSVLVTDNAGNDLVIDMTGAETVGDIITKFNNAITADPAINDLSMQINASGTGFEIVDNNPPQGFSIAEASENSQTAASLGIVGDIGPSLVGEDLNPKASFKIDENGGTTAADLGILGSFQEDFFGDDLDPTLTATSNIADFNNANGFEWGNIILNQGGETRRIDLSDSSIVTVQDMLDTINNCGLNITASINDSGMGFQIVNNDPYQSFTIQDETGSRLTKDLGIYGSSDMMGSVLILEDALRNNDQEAAGLLIKNLEDATQNLLNHRASVGARGKRLEETTTMLTGQELTLTERLSEVEDADLTKLVTDLSTYEANYQAALYASAAIIQPTLLNFLD